MTRWGADPHREDRDRWGSWPSDDQHEYGLDRDDAAETTMPLPVVDDRHEREDDRERGGAGATPLDRLGWGESAAERRRPTGARRGSGSASGRVVMAAALAVAVFGAAGIAALANSGGPDVIAEPGRSGVASTTRPAPSPALPPTEAPGPAQETPARTVPELPINPGSPRPVVPVQPPITGSDETSPRDESPLPSDDAGGDSDAAGDDDAEDTNGGAAGDEDAGTRSPTPRSDTSDDAGGADDSSGDPTLIPIRPDPPQEPPAPSETSTPETSPESTAPGTTAPTTTVPPTTVPPTSVPETTPPTSSSVAPSAEPSEETQEPGAPRTVGPILIPTEPDGSLPEGPIVIPTGPDGALPTGTVTASPERDRGERPDADGSTTTPAPSTTTTTGGPAPLPNDPPRTGAGASSGAASRPSSPTTSGSLPPAAGRLVALLPAQSSGVTWRCSSVRAGVDGAPGSGRWVTCTPVSGEQAPADSAAAAQPRPAGRAGRRASSRSGLEVV